MHAAEAAKPATPNETVRKVGVPFALGYNLPYQEHGRDRVQWRVIVELSSTVGAKQVHEVHVGGNATPGCSAATLGLSLADTLLHGSVGERSDCWRDRSHAMRT